MENHDVHMESGSECSPILHPSSPYHSGFQTEDLRLLDQNAQSSAQNLGLSDQKTRAFRPQTSAAPSPFWCAPIHSPTHPTPSGPLIPLAPSYFQAHNLGCPISVLVGHTSPVTYLNFSPIVPHVLLSSSFDGTCRLWNATDAGAPPMVLHARAGFAQGGA